MTGPSPSLPAPQDGAERLAANCRERFHYAQPLSDVFDLTFGYSEQTRASIGQAICRKRCLRREGARRAQTPLSPRSASASSAKQAPWRQRNAARLGRGASVRHRAIGAHPAPAFVTRQQRRAGRSYPCNSGAPADISRTRRALLLSYTQASVAEFRRETLAPDDERAPRLASARRSLIREAGVSSMSAFITTKAGEVATRLGAGFAGGHRLRCALHTEGSYEREGDRDGGSDVEPGGRAAAPCRPQRSKCGGPEVALLLFVSSGCASQGDCGVSRWCCHAHAHRPTGSHDLRHARHGEPGRLRERAATAISKAARSTPAPGSSSSRRPSAPPAARGHACGPASPCRCRDGTRARGRAARA